VLGKSGRKLMYEPRERMGCVVVNDFPSLGRLTALRFLEWLQKNPEGVVCLPTGRTPETFIKWTRHFLRNWEKPAIRRELEEAGLTSGVRPRMDEFTFVQIDEFYPMNPAQANSFAHYIKEQYIDGFGFDATKALLMDTWSLGSGTCRNLGEVFAGSGPDLSLRYRRPRNEREAQQASAIAAADEFAWKYEERIRELGGIGFFLGGLGPDGHVGFNIRGSDPHSTTRLTSINYETAAAAATDLGGIEVSQQKAVLTVGLATIAQNLSAVAVLFVAGEAKSKVVADAVEQEPSVMVPATALHVLTGARVYMTRGASIDLMARRRLEIEERGGPTETERVRILVDAAANAGKRLEQLTAEDVARHPLGNMIRREELEEACMAAALDLRQRIGHGVETLDGTTFLHTGPHHDDILLGYLPYIVHQVRRPLNRHFFAVLTSGFTAVTNEYALKQMKNLREHLEGGLLDGLMAEGYFRRERTDARNRDIFQYLDGVAAKDEDMRSEGEARRMMRNLVALLDSDEPRTVHNGLERLQRDLEGAYPGQKDSPTVQTLKGMIREWEEELAWAHVGIPSEQVFHLRLGFYTGDLFTPQPEEERDVRPIVELLERTKPEVMSVALDPEGSGPDTHYKVLQATSEAVKLYLKNRAGTRLTILGYRNVWQRFHPAEANLYVPLSMNGMAILRTAFHVCFGSQRSASFPSYALDGPFCDLAQRIMLEQYRVVKTCLGREFFQESASPWLRAARGLNFLKVMTPEELFHEAAELRKAMELERD